MKRFLLGVTVLGAGLAGCGGDATNSSNGGSATTTTTTSSSTSSTGGDTSTSSGGTGGDTGGTGGSAGATGGTGGSAGATGGSGGAPAVCGDGAVTPPEECDDGNLTDKDGCDADCTFTCVDPVTDCGAEAECQQNSCAADHTCETAADPAQEGMLCGGGGAACKTGVCVPFNCGNGVLEGSEECDFGAGNGPGSGCELNCTYSCSNMPDSCPDLETCNGVEVCADVTVNGAMGRKCMAGTPLSNCAACLTGLCNGGVCMPSSCGDGCVDAPSGEQCEPPGSPTCDATCKTIVVAECGNSVREGGEQCDDGNINNLDGCSATCQFEQDMRSSYLKIQYGLDPYCENLNQLGTAFSILLQPTIQTGIDQGVTAGTTGFLFTLLGLDPLNGGDDPSVQVGVVRGSPAAGAGYNGASDLDWWYTLDPSSADVNRVPVDKIPGSVTTGILSTGQGPMSMPVSFLGTVGILKLASAHMQVSVGPASTPTASAGGTPGHLGTEHLDPALQSIATLGAQDLNGSGKLCGDVVARSLAQTAAPASILVGGQYACTQGYTAQNSLLDVIVSGCTVSFVPAVAPTQPDKSDPSAPIAGAGAPYTLTANAARVVTGCKDKNNASVTLSTCLTSAAYSSYFRFAATRVIMK